MGIQLPIQVGQLLESTRNLGRYGAKFKIYMPWVE